jgi:hypothetical protein
MQAQTPAAKQGGKREGAGRKPKDEPVQEPSPGPLFDERSRPAKQAKKKQINQGANGTLRTRGSNQAATLASKIKRTVPTSPLTSRPGSTNRCGLRIAASDRARAARRAIGAGADDFPVTRFTKDDREPTAMNGWAL